jgi:hypothetical protein
VIAVMFDVSFEVSGQSVLYDGKELFCCRPFCSLVPLELPLSYALVLHFFDYCTSRNSVKRYFIMYT